MTETIIFLFLCVFACWVGSRLPGPGGAAETADLLAETLRRVLRRL